MSDTPDPVVARNPSEAVASFDHHSRGTLDRLQLAVHNASTDLNKEDSSLQSLFNA